MPATVEIQGRHLEVRADGKVLLPCRRCCGVGQFNEYRRVNGGACFECYGDRGDWIAPADADATFRRRDKDQARRDKKRLAKLAKRDQERAAWAEANPEAAAILADVDPEEGHHILRNLADKLSMYGPLNDKQTALVVKIAADIAEREVKREAERAAAEEIPTGRQAVTGEVIKVAARENDYSYHAELVWRMTVKDDRGFLINTTIPAALRDAVMQERDGQGRVDDLRGRRVTFTANLEVGDDPMFGFGKRPSKAELFEEAPAAA